MRLFKWIALPVMVVAALAATLVTVITFSTPQPPATLPSIDAPFHRVDFSDLPPLRHFSARDGAELAYRAYGDGGAGNLLLLHGSSGNSASLHALAKALASNGYRVYVPDIRGHGASGSKGTIDYIGQLEDDLDDLVNALALANPPDLIGFSSGGGFALRFAASDRQCRFAHYVLLAPYLGHDANTVRPDNGWASAAVPRIAGLMMLNAVGITGFNDLPVVDFAIAPEERQRLTPTYSFALLMNFGPHRDHQADIAAAHQPMAVLVGRDDELFHAERFAAEFAPAQVPVMVLDGLGHIDLTVAPRATTAVANALRQLHATPPTDTCPSTPSYSPK